MRIVGEELIDFFNNDFFVDAKLGTLKVRPTEFFLTRTKRLDIELKITIDGWYDEEPKNIPMGTFYKNKDTFEFYNHSNTVYIISGVIQLRKATKSSRDGSYQTIIHYAISEIKMQTNMAEEAAYIIEWVGNLSSRLIGNSNLHVEEAEKIDIEFDGAGKEIKIQRSKYHKSDSWILKLCINNIDIYIVNTQEEENQKETKNGYILYRGSPSIVDRVKIRNCFSFIIGLPVILFGYSEYSANNFALRMASLPAYSLGGRLLELHDLPPYPIATGTFRNMTDIVTLEKSLNALYAKYDEIKFDELCWSYWNGACATAPMSTVYFAGLCERLQRIWVSISGTKDNNLICHSVWQSVETSLIGVIENSDIDLCIKKILKSKIANLNHSPQNIAFEKLFKNLGLSISEIERKAWRQRNTAAHGGMRGSHENMILDSKLIRLLFHRLLAAITLCSEYYYDYYSLDFPRRHIREQIPERITDQKNL